MLQRSHPRLSECFSARCKFCVMCSLRTCCLLGKRIRQPTSNTHCQQFIAILLLSIGTCNPIPGFGRMDGRRLVLPCIALVGVILFLPFLFGLIPSRPKPLTTSSAPATDFTEVQTPERIEPLAKAANPEAQVAPAAAQEGSAAQEAAWGYFPLPPAPEFPDGAEALTPAYAKQLWTEALPLPPKDNPSVDLVVSRCVEDQKWIGTFAPQLAKVCQLRVLVYEKCLEGKRGIVSEQLEPFHLVKIALPNVGYEGHTFLHHLIASSTFPDLVFFLQGHDPRVHMRTANIDLLTYFRCIIQQPQKFLRNGFRYVSDERWEFFTRKQACWEGYYQVLCLVPGVFGGRVPSAQVTPLVILCSRVGGLIWSHDLYT